LSEVNGHSQTLAMLNSTKLSMSSSLSEVFVLYNSNKHWLYSELPPAQQVANLLCNKWLASCATRLVVNQVVSLLCNKTSG
jgi:hypothetical protein